eukprot:Blabericola_migrator_1__2767@NODE_1790_length_3787_cov_21_397849_g1154_i0_p3_GENE_NODE_1790_length_3787_cov_21_397849_g1154_i0NODE_1790_length_3787_cov_21_397849_g1154_i0_p3_ORF_typecomplete_len162_score11_67_NODE_1790_length_3787_cov_21_397849_g1154_i0193678
MQGNHRSMGGRYNHGGTMNRHRRPFVWNRDHHQVSSPTSTTYGKAVEGSLPDGSSDAKTHDMGGMSPQSTEETNTTWIKNPWNNGRDAGVYRRTWKRGSNPSRGGWNPRLNEGPRHTMPPGEGCVGGVCVTHCNWHGEQQRLQRAMLSFITPMMMVALTVS